MFDVFYSGKKPNVVVGVQEAESIDHARQLSRTRYFWWIHYLADLEHWDFSWEPVPWQSHQRHAWPNQHQPDAGIYLVPANWDEQETNYHSAPAIHHAVDPSYWHIPDWIDAASIDLQWSPDPMDPPYIYEFPVEWGWDRIGGPQYRVPGASEIKYVNAFVTKTQHNPLPWFQHCKFNWTDEAYRWRPCPEDPPYIYVFGNQWYPAEVMPTVEYRTPGATERKYMDLRVQLPERHDNHWHTLHDCEWDYSWVPDPGDPPYIYVFGNQHWPAEKMPTVEYHVPGATERKYMHMTARLLSDKTNWTVNEYIKRWDYSWVPDPNDPPYIYIWGNQHWPGEIMPTVTYTVPDATEIKYVDGPQPELGSCMGNWEWCEDINDSDWDWTWVPNPKDPPYIYVFGNQWNPPELKASIKYHVDGATEVKYMDRRTTRLPQPDLFTNVLPVTQFDYSWEPDSTDPPMTYVFGSQWNPGVLEPAVTYSTGGTEIKYVDNIIAQVAPTPELWTLLDDVIEFDYSWRPNPTDPPYIYVFGNQWLSAEVRPALEYHVPGATERKYMDHPRAQRRGNPELFVRLHPCAFDWSWEPEPGSPPYNYVFGNQWHAAEIMPTVEYRMPGATELKYMDEPKAKLPENPNRPWYNVVESDMDYSWVPDPGDPPYIYVFGNQWHSAEIMPTVEYRMPGATERKYMDISAQLLPDMTHWRISNHVDVKDIDFSWVPDPGEPPYIYQFATQHQKTGGPQYRVPGASEVKYVDMMRAEVKREAVPIFEIDHMDGNAGQIPNVVKKIRYFDNYRDTLIRLAKSLVGEYEHVWVCSSVCDYTDFDFSWHPETWQSTMLHVFPSNKQKFGDTFYMHVPTFAERAEKKQLLEWYSVNYVSRRPVPRRPMPVIVHDGDSQVDAVKSQDFVGPLAMFTNHDYVPGDLVTVPLWRQETKTIVPVSSGAGSVVVPKVAVPFIKTQLYDYPHIDKTQRMLKDKPLDIVFISNGEINADRHFAHLASATCNLENRLHRVDGVNGRVAAYHAAAQVSCTPWFFAVFAKLQVNKEFDWNWQPDRMQQSKHYIFHAENPLNGLVYGHQAMIAYNKKLVLENKGLGLDFTLDQPHEVVPILSGTAWYTDSPWMAWRTAFREVIKLMTTLPDVESEYRLNKWLDDNSDEADPQWSRLGAEDAEEYYNSVNGDFAELRKSYDWAWLASYAFMRRSLTTDQ
jgi:hypothetical protein